MIMLKHFAIRVGMAVALSSMMVFTSVSAQTYVMPNIGYESEPVPAYRNEVPVAKPLWSVNMGRPSEAAEYGGDRVATDNGYVYYWKEGTLAAANARSGAVAWTYGKNLLEQVSYNGGQLWS
jgi:hypothetical protein